MKDQLNTNAITLTYNGVEFSLYPKPSTECNSNLSFLPNGEGEFTRIQLTSFTGTLCIVKSFDEEKVVASPQRDKSVTVEDEDLLASPNRKEPQFVSPPPDIKYLKFHRKRRTPPSAPIVSISSEKVKRTRKTDSKSKKLNRNITHKKAGACNISPLESFFTTLGQSTSTQLSQSSTEGNDNVPQTELQDSEAGSEAQPTSLMKTTTDFSVLETICNDEINDDCSKSHTKYVDEDDNSNTIMEFDDDNSMPGPEMTTSNVIEYVSKVEDEMISKQEGNPQSILDKNIPYARWGQSMVLIDNSQLLIYGGEAADADGNKLKTLSDIHVYDMVKQRWTKPINCNGLSRAWHSVTFLPDRQLLIAFGGESIQDNTQKTTTMEKIMVLDTEIMLWYPPSISGVAPSACSGHTATLLPNTNKLVVFGGVKNNRWKNNTTVLDTQCWSWKVPKVTGLTPRARSDHTTTLVSRADRNGHILVLFGGRDGTMSFNSVHVLNATHDNKWSWFHPTVSGTIPSPRSGHSATLLEDNKTILVYGGWDLRDEDSQQNKNEDIIYGDTYLLNTESWRWRPGPKPKFVGSSGSNGGKKRVGHSAVLAPSHDAAQVLVFGGRLPNDELACDIQTFTIPRRMLQDRER